MKFRMEVRVLKSEWLTFEALDFHEAVAVSAAYADKGFGHWDAQYPAHPLRLVCSAKKPVLLRTPEDVSRRIVSLTSVEDEEG